MSGVITKTKRPEFPTHEQLEALFRIKYGDPEKTGWGPRLRRKFRYYNPDDHYEALMAELIRPGCLWLDVGCGRNIFPSNHRLSRELADRCSLLVGVDPDETINDNPFVDEKVQTTIDRFEDERKFDVITLRMVAEHVEEPDAVVTALARQTKKGGFVVIYTVNRYSPVPILTNLIPFKLHHPIKQLLWRTEREDTFPTRFRMNTRRKLKDLFEGAGFREVLFARLDDCRTLQSYKPLLYMELSLRSAFHALKLPYPEYCLLAVFQRF